MIETGRSVFETFEVAAARWPDCAFLAVGPLEGRGHDPEGIELSYAQTADAVRRLATLLTEAGYGRGHRLALLQGNRVDHFLWVLAMNAVGCVAVPLPTEGTPEELAYVIAHSEAALVVGADPYAPALTQAIAICDTDVPLACGPAAPLPKARRPESGRAAPSTDDIACVLYTSGTTGKPKGCEIPNDYFLHIGRFYEDAGGLAELREAQERIFTPLPVFHQNAGLFTFMGAMLTGNCLVLTDRFHASSWWQEVADSRATVIHYLGVMPAILLHCPDPAPGSIANVRFGIGAGVDPTLHVAFEKRFGFPLIELWGMTETGGGFVASHEPRDIHKRAFGRPGSRAGFDFDIRIVDGDDRDMPCGAAGELLVRRSGPNPRKAMFAGYLKDPKATDEVWTGGWFHTGDVVVQDETGMLSFVERKKNIIRRAGENIAASEVEAVIAELPGVRQAVVLAVPDPIREEEVMAVIVPEEGRPTDDLAESVFQACVAGLAYYKAPAWILFRTSLPATSTQKVQKQKIFEAGEDPLLQPGLMDFRDRKKPVKQGGDAV